MAGSYYNGYTKSLPRVGKAVAFRLSFTDTGTRGGKTLQRERLYTKEQAEVFAADRAALAGLAGVSGLVAERWHRTQGWVAV